MTAFSAPLIWPPEVPRHVGERTWGPFLRTQTSTVVQDLEDELRRMGATNIAVTTNVRVGRVGRPDHELLVRNLPDPGVAVYLHRKGRDLVFALDRFQSPKSNLRALTLALDEVLKNAERMMLRIRDELALDEAFAPQDDEPDGEPS